MIAASVYLLAALTSMTCTYKLARTYMRSRYRLLLWSAVCFAGLALSNVLLFIDLIILPKEIDLALMRIIVSDLALAALVFGLVWEAQ